MRVLHISLTMGLLVACGDDAPAGSDAPAADARGIDGAIDSAPDAPATGSITVQLVNVAATQLEHQHVVVFAPSGTVRVDVETDATGRATPEVTAGDTVLATIGGDPPVNPGDPGEMRYAFWYRAVAPGESFEAGPPPPLVAPATPDYGITVTTHPLPPSTNYTRLGDGCSRGPLDLTLTPTAPCLNAANKAEILALAQQNAKIIGFAFAHDVALPAAGMTSEVALPDWSPVRQFVIAVDSMPVGASRLVARVSMLANASAPIFEPSDQADFTPGEAASLAIPVPDVSELAWRWLVEAIDPALANGGATGALHASATYSNATITAADLLPRYTMAAAFDANGTPTYTITGDTTRATGMFVQQAIGYGMAYITVHPGEPAVTLPPLPSSLAAFAVDVSAPPGLLAVAGSYITTEAMARTQLWKMIGLGFNTERNNVPLETTTYLSSFQR